MSSPTGQARGRPFELPSSSPGQSSPAITEEKAFDHFCGASSSDSEYGAKISYVLDNGHALKGDMSKHRNGELLARTQQQLRILTFHAGTKERIDALNIGNITGSDGYVRGRVIPVNGARQTWASWLVAISTLCVFISWPYFMATLFILSFFSKAALTTFLLLMSTLLLPHPTLLWTPWTCSFIMRTWQEYFDFSWTIEEQLTVPDQEVIFAHFPHGVFPLGPILAAGPCAIYFPARKVFELAASAVFMLPLFKHLMTWVGAAPASRKKLAKLLGMGSVAVIVGGIAEMFMVRKDREEILLRGRKGLMRTSIETGTPIVPVYFLGGSQVLSFGPTWLKALSRRLRTSIGFVFGRMGLPIPHQIPIHMVSGKVLWPEVMASAPDDPEYESELAAAIEAFTERLASETQALYERHRHTIPGWEARPLHIH